MLQALQLDQVRMPQSLHEQGCECDFDRVERQERDDALREADGEGDVHQVYVPKCTEGVAGKNAQDHGTDQRPEGLGAGGDETDDACAEDVADDVAAGRTGDQVKVTFLFNYNKFLADYTFFTVQVSLIAGYTPKSSA